MGVSSLRIASAAREQNLTELAQVQQATRAGTGCATCHPEIRELLAELAGALEAPMAMLATALEAKLQETAGLFDALKEERAKAG